MKYLESISRNPYYNLATEEYVLRNFELDEPVLLLYINQPTVVLGKNQNVYEEAHLEFCENNGILIARRLTGGGTVYHDEGNLNYSFISPFTDHLLHNFEPITAPVIEALAELGVEVHLNERNDLFYRDFKVSGTAQFTNRRNIISHGTLLFDSNLTMLSGAIHPPDWNIESKSIRSTRSKVINLKDVLPGNVTLERVRKGIVEKAIGPDPESSRFLLSEEDIHNILQLKADKYATFEWLIEKSPKFTLFRDFVIDQEIFPLEVVIDKGIIITANVRGKTKWQDMASEIGHMLVDKSFQKDELLAFKKGSPASLGKSELWEEVIQYLSAIAPDRRMF